MKILLISGHGAGDTGATGCGYKEADLTRTATSILAGYLNADGAIVTRYPASRDAYQDNKIFKLKFIFSSFDLVVEIHFNSYNRKAYGTEVLYKPSGTKALASKVSAAIASFGFYNRGAKRRTNLMNMNTCSKLGVPYILIETAFIDNKEDMALYKIEKREIWAKVAAVITKHYGVGKTPQNQNKPASKPSNKPSSTKTEKIKEDGDWGKATTSLTQKVLGTTVDGIVSNQPESNRKYLPNCYETSWQFKESGYEAGSSVVRAIQKLVRAKVDGWMGHDTVCKMQVFLGVEKDGYCGPDTVRAWQKCLNSKVK